MDIKVNVLFSLVNCLHEDHVGFIKTTVKESFTMKIKLL